MNTAIRAARPSDVESIANFQMAMARETEGVDLDPQKCFQGVSGVFEKPTRGRYFVAEVDGQVVASTLVQDEWSDWRNGVVWWIHSVYVRPEFRGQKIFRKIYDHLKALGHKDPQFRGFRLFVEKHNQKAQTVYQALGMSSERYDLYEWMTEF